MEQGIDVAVVGATGLVGRTMVKVLEERNFPINNLLLFSSERGAGTKINFRGENLTVSKLSESSFDGIDIALFSAGKSVSKQYSPIAAAKGCVVVDNGSYWRMHKDVPLVVPEVNPDHLKAHNGIIANPNCSTIQLVAVLKPIHNSFGLRRVVVSTYQSITGAGQKGINQLMSEIRDETPENKVTNHPIAFNTVFHSVTDDDGFSEEEIKMIQEPRKILGLSDLKLAVTCVRLPILGGHGESVNIETEKPTDLDEIRLLLDKTQGLRVIDYPKEEKYPTPLLSKDKNEVFIGRIRKDNSVENGIYMWIVADNVRKGAATNAVQIAETLIERNLLSFERISFE